MHYFSLITIFLHSFCLFKGVEHRGGELCEGRELDRGALGGVEQCYPSQCYYIYTPLLHSPNATPPFKCSPPNATPSFKCSPPFKCSPANAGSPPNAITSSIGRDSGNGRREPMLMLHPSQCSLLPNAPLCQCSGVVCTERGEALAWGPLTGVVALGEHHH